MARRGKDSRCFFFFFSSQHDSALVTPLPPSMRSGVVLSCRDFIAGLQSLKRGETKNWAGRRGVSRSRKCPKKRKCWCLFGDDTPERQLIFIPGTYQVL